MRIYQLWHLLCLRSPCGKTLRKEGISNTEVPCEISGVSKRQSVYQEAPEFYLPVFSGKFPFYFKGGGWGGQGDITNLFTAALFGGLSGGMEILALVIHNKSGCTRCQESSALLLFFFITRHLSLKCYATRRYWLLILITISVTCYQWHRNSHQICW